MTACRLLIGLVMLSAALASTLGAVPPAPAAPSAVKPDAAKPAAKATAKPAAKPAAKAAPKPAMSAADKACAATCAAYTKATLLERQVALKSGCPTYVSAVSDPIIARIRLAPELASSLGSAVDDEVWFEINGKDVWHRTFRNKDNAETLWKKDMLHDGCNTLSLFYADTKGPDAYFMVNVGGLAFCGADGVCGRNYREGLTFGTGLIYKIPALHVPVWDSKLANPNADGVCQCEDPTRDEMYEAMAPYAAHLPVKN